MSDDLLGRAMRCARHAIAASVESGLRAGVDQMRAAGASDLKIAEMLVLVAEASNERALYDQMRATLERQSATLQ